MGRRKFTRVFRVFRFCTGFCVSAAGRRRTAPQHAAAAAAATAAAAGYLFGRRVRVQNTQISPEFLTLPQVIPTSMPIPVQLKF